MHTNNSQQQNNSPTTSSTKLLGEPKLIVVYNNGNQLELTQADKKYTVILEAAEDLIRKSALDKSDSFYGLALYNGDISGFRKGLGVELIYNAPIPLNITKGVKHNIYRAFISIDQASLLVSGNSNGVYDQGAVPLADDTNLFSLIEDKISHRL